MSVARKAIGSQWMFNPLVAGYGTVWRPAVCTIQSYPPAEDVQPPTKNGFTPPRRDYTVTMPGGIFLFANEESLSDKDAPPPPPPVAAPPKTIEQLEAEIRVAEANLAKSLGYAMDRG
jgi:hypothetical protein